MRKLTFGTVSRLATIAGALAIGLMVSAAPQISIAQQRPLTEGVAAIVNDEPITRLDVRQRTQFLLATSGRRKSLKNWCSALPPPRSMR
ncbi:MAG: hypothetical protein HC777_00695 [Hyphomonadaceae bacterium]|nr:hypothetical protein [Hyphomonadaceae bacterium]